MAKERRVLRLQQLILEILAETLQREIADPRLGLVSITRVRLTSDLSQATVHWSALGEERDQRLTARALQSALPFLQRRVARDLHTRTTPHLVLRFDAGLERAQHLEGIFDRLRQERETLGEVEDPEAPPAEGDADPEPSGG